MEKKIPTSETVARASSAQIKADRITCILLDNSYDDDDNDSRAFHFCQTGCAEQVKRERGIPGKEFLFFPTQYTLLTSAARVFESTT